jgi:hypothetical protein
MYMFGIKAEAARGTSAVCPARLPGNLAERGSRELKRLVNRSIVEPLRDKTATGISGAVPAEIVILTQSSRT